MSVRKELFVCLGTALATTAGLFTLQVWYASYLDVAVVHGDKSDVRMDAKLEAVRNQEHAKLTSGSMPIDKAMEALAQRGRSAFPKLATKPSGDLSAMSGWIHRPGFKMYVPRPAAALAAEATPLAERVAAAPKVGEGAR
jgi:hypothetical protein